MMLPRVRRLVVLSAVCLLAGACSIPRWPVSGVMTSPYGLRVRAGSPGLHHGVDIAAPEGTPVQRDEVRAGSNAPARGAATA
jgi:hypothetical protein